MELPKAINCRLGTNDTDIQLDLAEHTDKTARIKEIYRLGLQLEAMKLKTHMIPSELTASMYRLWIDELKKRHNVEREAVPS